MPDVVIVGAGPVGLTLACILRASGDDVIVLEKNTTTHCESRALNIWARNSELLHHYKFTITEGLHLDSLNFIYGMGPSQAFTLPLDPDPKFSSHKCRGLPQWVLERDLAEELECFGGADGKPVLRRGVEITAIEKTDKGITVRHQSEGEQSSTDCQYLIGCDGSRSLVRTLCGFPFTKDSSSQGYLWICDARFKPECVRDPYRHCLACFIGPKGAVFRVPVYDETYRFVLYRSPDLENDKTEEARIPSFEEFVEYLDQSTMLPQQIQNPQWISAFKEHFRSVQNLKDPATNRIFLAGDAGHIHSTFGGQGMNLGLQEAFNLGWKLSAVLSGKYNPSILDTYQLERLPVAQETIRYTEIWSNVVKKLISSKLRRVVLSTGSFVAKYFLPNFAEKAVCETLNQLRFVYPKSHINIQGQGRMPDSDLVDRQDQNVRLYASLGFRRFNVVYFDGVGQENLDNENIIKLLAIGELQVIRVVFSTLNESWKNSDYPCPVLLAKNRLEVREIYGTASKSCIYIVRPDLCVATISCPASVTQVQDFLESVLIQNTQEN